jgi:hypothetical protein
LIKYSSVIPNWQRIEIIKILLRRISEFW